MVPNFFGAALHAKGKDMKAILYALKSPEGWICALFLAAVLVVPAGLRAARSKEQQ